MTWHRHQKGRFQEIRKSMGLSLQNEALRGCASTRGSSQNHVTWYVARNGVGSAQQKSPKNGSCTRLVCLTEDVQR